MSDIIERLDAAIEGSKSAFDVALKDYKKRFTLGDTIASEDPGCIAAIPSELTGLAKAIGLVEGDYNGMSATKWKDDILNDVAERFGPTPINLVPAGRAGWGDHAVQPANDNYPPVVAFTGQAGAGKSTATRYLVENHGYTLVKFAGPLKDMMRAIGLSEEQIEGELKEVPCRLLQGKTPRHAMQTVGTQWGRDCIGKDFWLYLWSSKVEATLAAGGRVVVDDCRFPNEAAAVRKLGGDVYMIAGRGGIPGEHESERGAGEADLVIANDGPVARLHGKVEEALKRYG